LRLLVVEDEPFIALDLEMLIEAQGHEVVGIADTYDTAVELAASHRPDAAFVDLNLRDGLTGLAVARTLVREHEVAVVFVTGNAEQIPADFAGGAGVVDKPFTQEGVAELIGILEHAREGLQPPATRYARAARG
jgi:CheY-like chemotaxis protein